MSVGPYASESVVNAVLEACEGGGVQPDPMKLQKLLYLAHGYYLAKSGHEFVYESFEVWEYGPVLPSVYHEFKPYGGNPIPKGRRVVETVWESSLGDFIEIEAPAATLDDLVASQIVDFVIGTYGAKPAVYLSELTHKVGSPWYRTREKHPTMRHLQIPNPLIAEYFKPLVTAKDEAHA